MYFSQNKPLLALAAIHGHMQAMRALIDSKADINTQDQWLETPLHVAIGTNDLLTVGTLIKAHAQLEIVNILDQTPIQKALGFESCCNYKINDIVHLLIEGRANVQVKHQYGNTLLHLAAKNRPNTITMLLRAGLNTDAKNNEGQTALHNAQSKEAVIELIEAGADIHALDNTGNAPLDLAVIRYNQDTIKDSRKAQVVKAFITTISHSEIQHLIPTMGVFQRRKVAISRNVGNLVIAQLIPAIIGKKLALAREAFAK